jgi:hypothetical protein
MAIARNIRTGKVSIVPNHYIGHPVLGKELVLETGESSAAPKNEKKQNDFFVKRDKSATTEIKEQPAPETTEE